MKNPALPGYSLSGLTILDVGCQDGSIFSDPVFSDAKALYGIDIDRQAIRAGQRRYPHLQLIASPAEACPLDDAMIDVVISRVSLPYTHIPTAMAEIYRTMKPGGRIFLSMHDRRLQMEWLKIAIQSHAWKRVIDHAYIFVASWLYSFTGLCVARPWSGKYETYQTERRMKKEFRRAGLVFLRARRAGHHWVIEGYKPEVRDHD